MENFLYAAESIPGSHIVSCSIIPSPETNNICAEAFQTVNSRFKAWGNESSKISYVNLDRKSKYGAHGHLRLNLFHDGVHLNEFGSEEVANSLKFHLMRMSTHLFD